MWSSLFKSARYPVKGVVSIWVGNFPDTETFEEHIDAYLIRRLKLKIPIEAVCEVTHENGKSVLQLLEGFSGWQTFHAAVPRYAEVEIGHNCNSAIICYNVDYGEGPFRMGKLWYLGTFSTGENVQPV